jgi:hypothetical protein
MTFEEESYSYLSANAGLVALVGKRIYPNGEVPQEPTKPYCVHSRISSDRLYSHSGYSGIEDIGLQINCYSDNKLQARQVAIKVTTALEAWVAENSNVHKALRGDSKGLYDGMLELHFYMVEFSISHTFEEG